LIFRVVSSVPGLIVLSILEANSAETDKVLIRIIGGAVMLSTTQSIEAPELLSEDWDYSKAFSRNIGLLTTEEQEKLRNSRVAIAGMGGVGGVHLITLTRLGIALTRLGIGKFTIADPDTFEVANSNRQYGAKLSNLGLNKAEVMAKEALDINPQLDIRVINGPVDTNNVDEFFEGADLFADGLDFYVIEARRLAFRRAAEMGIWGVTVGPHAYGVSWLKFSPTGVSFDKYFNISDGDDAIEQLAAFAVGVVPAALHLSYVDLDKYFRPESKAAASLGSSCQIASGIMGTEVLRILLKKPDLRPAPWYSQFDAYRYKMKQGYLLWGNKHPKQRLRRRWLQAKMKAAMITSA